MTDEIRSKLNMLADDAFMYYAQHPHFKVNRL